jgi:hypothetical protein
LGVKPALNAKKTYTIVAAVLVVCLVLSGYLSLQFSVNASIRDQNSTQASPDPTPTSTTQPTDTSTNTPLAIPTQRPLLTKDEALKIAMPPIEEYATNNNRVISSVNATFYSSAKDLGGIRAGNPSPYQPITDPSMILSYPEWSIDAFFEPPPDSYAPGHNPSTAEGWIYGFNVLIWADNGQIRSATPQGLM